MLKTPLISAALGIALLTTPAIASQGEPSLNIEFGDLDLSTADGQKQLDRRISVAAREFCKANGVQTGTILRSSASTECVKQVRAIAYEQVAALTETEQRGG